MSNDLTETLFSRRELLGTVGKTAAAAAVAPVIQTAIVSGAMAADEAPLNAVAGVDRVTVLPGKTYLRGWIGYGDPPRTERPGRPQSPQTPAPTPPAANGRRYF